MLRKINPQRKENQSVRDLVLVVRLKKKITIKITSS